MKYLVSTLLLLACSAAAFAQQSAPATGTEFSFHNGIVFAGSGHSFRGKLKEQGFGVPASGKGFFDFSKNPKRNEVAVQLGVLHPVTDAYYVKGLFNFRESDVSGYKSDFSAIELKATNTTVGALAVRYLPLFSEHIRVGVGPTFNRLNNSLRYEESVLTTQKLNRPGFVLETGFSTPASSRVYMDLQLQYFYAGKTDLGSHRVQGANYQGDPVYSFVTFDKVSLSSMFFSLGVGLRLQKPE
jgi:opacity protein-like surface antigen